ncbi:GNAT family N-acetyltransferase [Streptomyces sp. M2CJ-2]|uniref:GNAT family N-acetyltransferase n=1 Tax=Streptomyces sp. M2CJ-2 TaxID=2803948 RepID=UPI001921BD65|nr:GNAT family N-acetyltransferase [Streptomyces sp. M2CJ-2]MBL3665946.1 GNAT family N-acetyltransferase [Streptomyces sp. M2CJ-2]
MTTTLRPAEPLQQNPDGTRSRRYQVCVNSRPVGRVRLGTEPVFGDAVARIMSLRIEEPDRRRGRGTVAALAAEEIARSWGCRRIEASVPADPGADAAFRLATALGYVVRNYAMAKVLGQGDTPPVLPEGSHARPMTDAEYGPWSVKSEADYAQSWAERGLPEAEARAKAAGDRAALLPDGLRTEGMLLSVLEHRGAPVGTLWLAVRGERAFVFDLEVGAAHRGQGHGRSLMRLAEAQAVAAGKRAVGLNVFTGNTPAERLYASLGYRTTRYAMYKHLL